MEYSALAEELPAPVVIRLMECLRERLERAELAITREAQPQCLLWLGLISLSEASALPALRAAQPRPAEAAEQEPRRCQAPLTAKQAPQAEQEVLI